MPRITLASLTLLSLGATAGGVLPFETGWPSHLSQYIAWIIVGILLVLVVTRTATARARMAPLQAALDVAHGRIKGFSDSQGRFVGNLAQEIKGPLTTTLISADLLLMGSNEPATVQRYATSIAEDMRHLSGLVDSFLRLVHPFQQGDTSRHVPLHFHDLVVEAVRRCQSLASTRAVSVVPMLAESGNGSSLEVLGDAVLLEAMIENLVRNAVLLAPRDTRVDLHVKIKGKRILLSVRDHGAKIDDDCLAAVFDGLFQAPIPLRSSAGTGLSLAIAKRVVEHHRGTISLRNVPEGGCEFEIQLPRWYPDGEAGANGHAGRFRDDDARIID